MSHLCAYRGHQSSRGPLRLSNRPVQPSLRRWTDHLSHPVPKGHVIVLRFESYAIAVSFNTRPFGFEGR